MRLIKDNVYKIACVSFSVPKKLGVISPASKRLNSGQGSTVVTAISEKIRHTNVIATKAIIVLPNGEGAHFTVNELFFGKGGQDRKVTFRPMVHPK